MRAPKKTLSIRLSKKAEEIARANAADHGVGFSEYIEQLLLEQGPTRVDYFAQQAAFQAFVSAAFTLQLAHRVLSPSEYEEAQGHAYGAATVLFGRPPRRPASVGQSPPDLDPRLTALFEAFAGR